MKTTWGISAALVVVALASSVGFAQHRPGGQSPGRGGQQPPPAPPRPSVPGPDVPRGRDVPTPAVRAPQPDARQVLERMKDRKEEGSDVCPPPGVAPQPDRFDWDAWWEFNGARKHVTDIDHRIADVVKGIAAVLRQTIDDGDPRVREASVIALGAVAEAEDVARLAALAAGADEALRMAAVLALGERNDPSALVTIRERLLDPRETIAVRGAAALAIGIARDASTAAEIRAIATHPDANLDFRVSTLLALGLLGEVAGPATVLANAAENDALRCAAAIALGKTGDPLAAEPLVAALLDPATDVRGAAAAGLGALGRAGPERLGAARDRASAALARMLATDASIPARALAAIALGEVNGTGAREALVRGLKRDPVDVRAAAALGLGLMRDPAMGPRLHPFARAGSRDEPLTAAAALGIGLARDAAAASVLISIVKDAGPPWVRSAAAEALGLLRATEAIPVLAKAVAEADVDRATASAALVALARMEVSDGHDRPHKTASDPRDPGLQAVAIGALSERGETRDLPFLASIARDGAAPGVVRVAAVRALGDLARYRTLAPITLILEDTGAMPRTGTLDAVMALR